MTVLLLLKKIRKIKIYDNSIVVHFFYVKFITLAIWPLIVEEEE